MDEEKYIDTIFQKVVNCNSILKEMCKSVKSVGTRPGTLYGLCKVHE